MTARESEGVEIYHPGKLLTSEPMGSRSVASGSSPNIKPSLVLSLEAALPGLNFNRVDFLKNHHFCDVLE
jgi:hypothetical protein